MSDLKILLVEDSRDDVFLIERELERSDMRFALLTVRNRTEFEDALRNFNADVILCDHSLPGFNSIEAFAMYEKRQKETGISTPFILVTGHVSEEFAIQSIKAGVDDYILKDRLKRLPLAIESALEKCRIENERARYLRQVVAKEALMNEAERVARFGSWESDPRTGKQLWSDSTFAIYGFTPGEVAPDYQFFLSRVHPDDREALEKTLEAVKKSPDGGEYEFRILTPKGDTRYISCRMQIQRDGNGEAVRFIGVNLDMTERKLVEMSLEKKTQEYRSLFDRNPDSVFSLDLSGTFTEVNDTVSLQTGFSRGDLLGMNFRAFIHPDDLADVNERFSASIEGQPQRYETRILVSNGKTITLDVTNVPIVVNEEIVGVYGVAKDISEKKELEYSLEQAYRHSRIGGWEFDVLRQKVKWTAITRELHEVGSDFQPDVENGISFFRDGRDRDAIREAVERCVTTGVGWDLELKIVTKKGNERWVRSIGAGEVKGGRCVRLYGTFQDIDERRRAQEMLRDAYENGFSSKQHI